MTNDSPHLRGDRVLDGEYVKNPRARRRDHNPDRYGFTDCDHVYSDLTGESPAFVGEPA